MLQKTHVISFFCGICLENHQIGSVPWCDKWKISSAFFMFFPTKLIKTAQYHNATNDVPHLIVFTVFCIKSGKAARYHDATNDARHLKFSCFFSMRSSKHIRTVANDTRHLMFSRYFQWKSPKRLSTTLLQMTDFICIFHRIPHEINQNGSVPRCYN